VSGPSDRKRKRGARTPAGRRGGVSRQAHEGGELFATCMCWSKMIRVPGSHDHHAVWRASVFR